MNYWLLLEKSYETRVSKGSDGYKDSTGQFYHYDSLVPNFKNIKTGDSAVFRVENKIIGIGTIGDIKQTPEIKQLRRCPFCDATDIRERLHKSPKYKCGKKTCAKEFTEPKLTQKSVQSFVAKIENFTRLNSSPEVKSVKQCAENSVESSQLSMIRLNGPKLKTLFEGIDFSLANNVSSTVNSGQGFGLSQPERKAVELRAMKLATKLYEDLGWEVNDVSLHESFDLYAKKGDQVRFIEVKGTTGQGDSIILTHGEVVQIGKNKRESALVLVSGIILETKYGKCYADGGVVALHQDPWTLIKENLNPTQYRYHVSRRK